MISVIIPSVRREALIHVVELFTQCEPHACMNEDMEILYVSPYPIHPSGQEPYPWVHWVEDIYMEGGSKAASLGHDKARGGWIVWWSDDAYPTQFCLTTMKSFLWEEMKRNPLTIGSFNYHTPRGDKLSQWQVYGKHYACWGMANRSIIQAAGQVLTDQYHIGWGDVDFSMRVWDIGGRVIMCPQAIAIIDHIGDQAHSENWQRYFHKDEETFINRWHQKYGDGPWGHWTKWNKELWL